MRIFYISGSQPVEICGPLAQKLNHHPPQGHAGRQNIDLKSVIDNSFICAAECSSGPPAGNHYPTYLNPSKTF